MSLRWKWGFRWGPRSDDPRSPLGGPRLSRARRPYPPPAQPLGTAIAAAHTAQRDRTGNRHLRRRDGACALASLYSLVSCDGARQRELPTSTTRPAHCRRGRLRRITRSSGCLGSHTLRTIYWLGHEKEVDDGVAVPAASMPAVRRALGMLRELNLELFSGEGESRVVVDRDGATIVRSMSGLARPAFSLRRIR